MSFTLTAAQAEQYRKDGYFILRQGFPRQMIEAMIADVRDLAECSATGQGPDFPWINKEKRLPERLGTILRPGWIRPSFIASLTDGPFFPIAEQILGKEARYCLFGMLAGGDGKPYVQGWHRDLAPTTGEDQLPVLERNYRWGIQINAPLFPDRYLTIVPGSHLRPTTQAEQDVLANNPTGDMPGQMAVEMEPGDVAFYYFNLLHRGYNPNGALRWTMHHAFSAADAPVGTHEQGQEKWIGEPGYLESLPPPLQRYMQRYLDAMSPGQPVNWRAL